MRIDTIAVAIFAFAAITGVRPMSAACSNESLKGVFGFVIGRPGANPAGANAGQFTADGEGHITKGIIWQSGQGVISSSVLSGTYSIAPDCTGSMKIDDTPFRFAMDNGNNGFQWILALPGHVQPGMGLAQGTVKCGLPGKKQTFATNFLGTIYPSGAPEAFVGQLTLDGKGKIDGKETYTVGSIVQNLSVTGTYTQATDCQGTVDLTLHGYPTLHFNTVMVSGGAGMLVIETDNGTMTVGVWQE